VISEMENVSFETIGARLITLLIMRFFAFSITRGFASGHQLRAAALIFPFPMHKTLAVQIDTEHCLVCCVDFVHKHVNEFALSVSHIIYMMREWMICM
jgi:hypothetical protein